jgi:capsular polysaccharide transport system permease protein
MDQPPTAVPPRRSPWDIQRAVVRALMMRELKTRFGGHWSGVVWVVVTPLAETAVLTWMYITLRSKLMRGSYEFIIWLLVAMLPFRLFSDLWRQLIRGASSNLGLFTFRQVRPLDAFIARACLEILTHGVLLCFILGLMAWMGHHPAVPQNPLGYLGVMAIFALLGTGLGVLTAVIVDVLPKFDVLVRVSTMPLYLFSGVIFTLDRLPQVYQQWLLLNPMLHLVELARYTYLPGFVMLNGVTVTYPLMWTLCVWTLALSSYWARRQQLVAS